MTRQHLLPAFLLAMATSATAALTFAASAGDPVNLSNTGTNFKLANANGTYWSLRIPPTPSLPAGTIVAINEISIGSRNSSFTPDTSGGSDANSVTLVGIDGNAVRSTVINGYNGTISVTSSATANKLTYTFSQGVNVAVGATNALTLCASNGNPVIYDGAEKAGTKVIYSQDSSSVLWFTTTAGYYPVYEISGTVVSKPTSTTISADTAASALTWSPAVVSGAQCATINVTADATLTLDEAISFADVTINIANGATLSLAGANSISASATTTRINGGKLVAGPSRLSGTISGASEIVYTNALPSGVSFTNCNWTGTVALENISGITGPNFNNYGNSASSIKFSGVSGWIDTGTEYNPEIILENKGYGYALKLTNGNSPQSKDYSAGANVNRCTVFKKVSGDGSLIDGNSSAWPVIKIYDASEFAGAISLNLGVVVFCTSAGDALLNGSTLYDLFSSNRGTFYVADGTTVTIPYGKSWTGTSATRFMGSGTVINAGQVQAGISNSTYTNWTGTVVISNVATAKNGSLYPFNLHYYGNTNSTVCLAAIGSTTLNTTHLPQVTLGKVVLVDDGVAPALRLSDGISDACTTFCELAGNGTLTNINAAVYQGLTFNVMTNFTGTLYPENMIVTFGTATRHGKTGGAGYNRDTMRRLYFDPDAKFSVPAGFTLWNPVEVVFNGPMNFTTDATDYSNLVLLNGIGPDKSKLTNEYFSVSINGVPLDTTAYRVRKSGGKLITTKKHWCNIILR